MNARVKPITPSPRFSFPKPVSHAESITSAGDILRLKISSVRTKPSAFVLPTSESTTPSSCRRNFPTAGNVVCGCLKRETQSARFAGAFGDVHAFQTRVVRIEDWIGNDQD